MEYSQQQLIYRKKLINISKNLNNAQNVITELLMDDVYNDDVKFKLSNMWNRDKALDVNTLYEENQQCN